MLSSACLFVDCALRPAAADTPCACPRPAAVAYYLLICPLDTIACFAVAAHVLLSCLLCPRHLCLPPCGAEIRVVLLLMCTMKSNRNIPLLASFTPQCDLNPGQPRLGGEGDAGCEQPCTALSGWRHGALDDCSAPTAHSAQAWVRFISAAGHGMHASVAYVHIGARLGTRRTAAGARVPRAGAACALTRSLVI